MMKPAATTKITNASNINVAMPPGVPGFSLSAANWFLLGYT